MTLNDSALGTDTASTVRPRAPFAGMSVLIRLGLRRDRIRLPAWTVTLAVLSVSIASSWDRLYPTAQSRLDLAHTLALDPALTAILGPVFDPLSTGGLTAWRSVAGYLLVFGLVSSFVVVRHTRALEQEGQSEIIAGGAVGRAALLGAGVTIGCIYGLVFGVIAASALTAMGVGLSGALAYSATIAFGAAVYCGVAALAAQFARTSRGANGLSGLVLGITFVLSAYGNGEPSASALIWLSPFGWAEQTRAFADERWWLLVLEIVVAGVLIALAMRLAQRRDLGASLVSARAGRDRARAWIRGPIALAWRLDRSWLLGWVVGSAALGAVEGVLLASSVDTVQNNPAMVKLIARLGGSGILADSFLVVMVGMFALVASGYGISTVLRLRSDETSTRAEQLWSAPITRVHWASGHVSTAFVGASILSAIAGLALGASYGVATGDLGGMAVRGLLAALVQLPATWVLIAIPSLLLGVRPAWMSAGWIVLAWCVLVGWFGAILGLPDWASSTSPFGHLPSWPGQQMRWLPEIILTLVAMVGVAVGAMALRRRDLPS